MTIRAFLCRVLRCPERGVVTHVSGDTNLRREAERALHILNGPLADDVGASPGEAAAEYGHRIDEAIRILDAALEADDE